MVTRSSGFICVCFGFNSIGLQPFPRRRRHVGIRRRLAARLERQIENEIDHVPDILRRHSLLRGDARHVRRIDAVGHSIKQLVRLATAAVNSLPQVSRLSFRAAATRRRAKQTSTRQRGGPEHRGLRRSSRPTALAVRPHFWQYLAPVWSIRRAPFAHRLMPWGRGTSRSRRCCVKHLLAALDRSGSVKIGGGRWHGCRLTGRGFPFGDNRCQHIFAIDQHVAAGWKILIGVDFRQRHN